MFPSCRRLISRLVISAVVLAGLCTLVAPASANPTFTFSFNSLAANVNSTNAADPIELYMESIYGSNITLANGAKTLKAKPENVGPTPFLGNTENGAYNNPSNPTSSSSFDTYLINRWNASSLPATERDRITIIFEDVPIVSMELDWQIFPISSTTGKADLTIKADGVVIFYQAAANKSQGMMGHDSFTFSTPVKKLEFIDWTDAPIGIDNLRVTAAPEPSTLVMAGVGLCLAGAYRLRRRRTAK